MNTTWTWCGCVLALAFSVHVAAQDGPELTAQQQKLLELTNAERKKNDLPPLKVSGLLCQVARAHAVNMAKQGKMEHVLDGKNPIDRLRAAGYKFNAMGENLAWVNGRFAMEALMKMWMDSKVHRDNILNPDVTEIGLGSAADANGKVYFAQEFGRPR